MKNKIIFIIMCLLTVGVVSASNTDFSQFYVQSQAEWSYYGNIITTNSFLLRATSIDTNMDYTLETWGFCDVSQGGSFQGGVPITLQDSNTSYIHRSVIVTYDNSIKQYGADCSVLDTYTMGENRTIVSKMGIIRQHRDGADYYSPNFAVVNYDNVTSKTYMTILTLNSETSLLTLDADVLISNTGDFTNVSNIFGVTGGCFDSTSVSCETDDRVFGVFNYDDSDIRIVNHVSGSWELKTQIDLGETCAIGCADVGEKGLSHNNMMFFLDYDADSHNEFLIYGHIGNATASYDSEIYLTRVEPLSSSPWFDDSFPLLDYNVINGDNADSSYHVDTLQKITPCQIGTRQSPWETCANMDDTISLYPSNIIIKNDFSTLKRETGNSVQYKGMPPIFTYDSNGDGFLEGCIYDHDPTGYFYKCYNETSDLISFFNITFDGELDRGDALELIVTEIDGDTTYPEIIYSDGTVESIRWNGNNIALTDWDAVLTDDQWGNMYVQDVSTDSKNEFIYITDDTLRIYSNDNTPVVFMNLTYEEEVAGIGVTSTTSTTLYGTSVDTSTAEGFVSSLNNNIAFIVGMILIIGFVVFVAGAGIKNPIVLLFVGLIGTVMVSLLGLISTAALILIIMVFVIMIILAMTIFKQTND